MPQIIAPPPRHPVEPGPVPSFSVIIAAYQSASFVADAVRSALEQTSPPHEVIICDDGSTDDIEDALEPHREQVLLLRRGHRGQGAAKDAAARAASGDFVAVLDADDIYLPERLGALAQAAVARPDLDIITTDAFVEADGQIVGRYYDFAESFEPQSQRRILLERNFIFGATAVRRKRLLEAGGFDELSFHADWECWMRLVFSGSLVGLVPEPLYCYRVHRDAMSSDGLSASRAQVETLEKARSLALAPSERSVLEASIARHRRAAECGQALQALRRNAPDARRRSVAVAGRRGNDVRTRIKAALAAVAPGVAGRLLQRRDGPGWVGAAGVTLPHPPDRRY